MTLHTLRSFQTSFQQKMILKEIKYIFYFILYVCLYGECGRKHKYKTESCTKGSRLNSTALISYFDVRSVTQCAVRCGNYVQCTGFNWMKADDAGKQCDLINVKSNIDVCSLSLIQDNTARFYVMVSYFST